MTCVFAGFSRSLLADIHALMSLMDAVNVWTAAVVLLTVTLVYTWLSSAYWWGQVKLCDFSLKRVLRERFRDEYCTQFKAL